MTLSPPSTRPDGRVLPLVDRLALARRETLALIGLVQEADLNRSLNSSYSPLRWHFGHIASYEESWLLTRAGGRASLRPEYGFLFDPAKHPKADRIHLPPLTELLSYAERVRAGVLDLLRRKAPVPLLRDGFIGELVYEHECQHQEIITFLLQMIPPDQKRRPDVWKPSRGGIEPDEVMIAVAPGEFFMGASGAGFSLDNERDPHRIALPAYRIARAPVTERAFTAFIEAGGYRDSGLWSNEGWRWRCEHRIEAPRDWSPAEAGGWSIRAQFEDRGPLPGVPVVGVSAHEAEAFARWAGLRLPTEAEWERAAAWDAIAGRSRRFPWGEDPPDAERANIDGLAWGTRPVGPGGRSPVGCDDMAGQVWEWTASAFAPYPGFRPYPYEGYSQAWFDGEHRVLRGGSWATRGPLCRCSFRNWYHPQIRDIFAGFRLAGDADQP